MRLPWEAGEIRLTQCRRSERTATVYPGDTDGMGDAAALLLHESSLICAKCDNSIDVRKSNLS